MTERRQEPTSEQDQAVQPEQTGLGQRLLGLLRGDKHLEPVPHAQAVLPSRVRDALQYGGARLSAEHVESLHRSGFPRAAFYLSMKASSERHEAQADMLYRLAGLEFDYEGLGMDDIRVGTAALSGQAGEEAKTVGGEKLGQFSRHGPTGDVEIFDRVIGRVLADRPNDALFVVANYPFIALDVMARHSLEKGNPLGIINPDHLAKREYPIGFMMDRGSTGLEVAALGHDFRIPPGSVIFDDVVREGKTKHEVMAWAGEAATFVNAIKVDKNFF